MRQGPAILCRLESVGELIPQMNVANVIIKDVQLWHVCKSYLEQHVATEECGHAQVFWMESQRAATANSSTHALSPEAVATLASQSEGTENQGDGSLVGWLWRPLSLHRVYHTAVALRRTFVNTNTYVLFAYGLGFRDGLGCRV